MAINYSSVNRFPYPTAGQTGWAGNMNPFFSTTLDEAICGYTTVSFSGNTTVSQDNDASAAFRNPFIKLDGVPGGTFTLTLPAIEKWWVIHNATAHAQNAKVSGQAGSVSIPAGKKMFLHSDGVDLQEAITYSANFVTSASPTFTGTTTIAALTASGNATIGGTLGVTGAATFNGAVTLGDASADTITVNGDTIFNNAVTLGSSAGDAITVTGTATFGQTISGSISGNAATATALATGRNFSITSDITAPAISFDGTGAVALVATIAPDAVTTSKIANNAVTGAKLENIGGLTPGSYGSGTAVPVITVDQQGRITAASTASLSGAFTEYFESSEIVVDNQSSGTVAHGLSGRPKLVQAVYRCKSANLNYSVDDEVYVGTAFVGDGEGVSVNASVSSTSATHVRYSFGTYQQLYAAFTGGVVSVGQRYAINPASWRLVIRAWY